MLQSALFLSNSHSAGLSISLVRNLSELKCLSKNKYSYFEHILTHEIFPSAKKGPHRTKTLTFELNNNQSLNVVDTFCQWTRRSLMLIMISRRIPSDATMLRGYDWDKQECLTVSENSSRDTGATQFTFILIWKGKCKGRFLPYFYFIFEQTDAIKWITIFGACRLMPDFSIWDRKPFKQYICWKGLKEVKSAR